MPSVALVLAALAAVLLAIAPLVARRLLPRPLPRDEVRFEELRRRYQKWDVLSLLVFFPALAAVALGWYLLLRWMGAQAVAPYRGARFLFEPVAPVWLLPAFFLGILTVWMPLALVMKLLLGARYAEYTEYSRRNPMFRRQRTPVYTTLCLLPSACFVLAALTLDTSARLDGNGFTYDGFWDIGERRYTYDWVREVASVARLVAPNGNVVDRPHYVVTFDDGWRWRTRHHILPEDKAVYTAAVEFLAGKAGVVIVERDLMP